VEDPDMWKTPIICPKDSHRTYLVLRTGDTMLDHNGKLWRTGSLEYEGNERGGEISLDSDERSLDVLSVEVNCALTLDRIPS